MTSTPNKLGLGLASVSVAIGIGAAICAVQGGAGPVAGAAFGVMAGVLGFGMLTAALALICAAFAALVIAYAIAPYLFGRPVLGRAALAQRSKLLFLRLLSLLG